MSERTLIVLPVAPYEYDHVDQERMRAIILEAIDELSDDITRSSENKDKVTSLAQRRSQFLLMGAS